MPPELAELVFRAATPEAIDNSCAQRLRSRGWTVFRPPGWETFAQLRKRLGISRPTFHRRMKARRELGIEVYRGQSGRVIKVKSNPVADGFLRSAIRKRPKIEKKR